MGCPAQGNWFRPQLPGGCVIGSATYKERVANEVCRKDREDGLTVERRLESPAKKMAPVAEVFIGALNVRMSILAMSLLMRPYTLTQTDQNTVKSSCNGAGHTFLGRWRFRGPP